MDTKQSDMSSKKAVVVPALEKALDILEYVAQQGASVSVKEISTRLDIPAATTYRTVNYLCSRNYLKEDTQSEGRYFLGSQILFLANQITRQRDLIHLAKPIMRELAAHTGQTVQLGVLQDFGLIYIDQVHPAKPVNIIAALRTHIPVNVSASGKVLVAHLPQMEQEYFLQNTELVQQTPKSIIDLTEFTSELQLVRSRGYALDNEEYARGIGCAAAPIRDHTGQVVAAIGMTGHIAAYTNDNVERLIGLVQKAAHQISAQLG